MVCIYCSGETKVTNSRPQRRANQVWRRRQCLSCDNVFTTLEAVDLTTSLLIHRNALYEPFQREKLLLSVYDSLRHRKDAVEAATALTNTIVGNLLKDIDNATVLRAKIVATTADVLKKFDNAAYVQYLAFHPL
jgi:transcriptional repressor NrdR